MSGRELRVLNSVLIWRRSESAAVGDSIRLYSGEPLNEFLALARDSSDDLAILRFARQWGPLGLCIHGQPLNHGRLAGHGFEGSATLGRGKIVLTAEPTPWQIAPESCQPRKVLVLEKDGRLEILRLPLLRDLPRRQGESDDRYDRRLAFALRRSQKRFREKTANADEYFAESLDAWRDYASAAEAVYETAHRLRTNQRPRAKHLRVLSDLGFGAGVAGTHFRKLAGDEAKLRRPPRREAWHLIGETLNNWLVHAPVRFFCETEESGKFDVDFRIRDERGIFPVLAAQLLATLTGSRARKPAICSGCDLPFIQAREPSTGKRKYCLPCRRAGVPVRDAVYAYRKRATEKEKS
jgi:hypothetical protein